MNARGDERTSGAADQEAFEKVIRENLSPEAVATIIAFLQPAAFCRPANEDGAIQLIPGEKQTTGRRTASTSSGRADESPTSRSGPVWRWSCQAEARTRRPAWNPLTVS